MHSHPAETPRHKCAGVLPSFHLFTLVRKGISMETERILCRPTLTVQDVTVDSARKPTLPSVTTPRCDLRPSPGAAAAKQPTKRRERCACTGVVAHLTVLRLLIGYNIAHLFNICQGIPACGRRAFHPPLRKQGLSSPVSVTLSATKLNIY